MADDINHTIRNLGISGLVSSSNNDDDSQSIDLDDTIDIDKKKPIVSIPLDDGSVDVYIDDGKDEEEKEDSSYFHSENLALKLETSFLSTMSDRLMRGIGVDEETRRLWLTTRAKGIDLLALKIKSPKAGDADLSAPVEGMSTYDDPMMLEAVIRGAANALGELLPTDGPFKVRNDNLDPLQPSDPLAEALERELNHYMTTTATEYYPDTDRMILMTYFGGIGFKKPYHCPIRNRPVSESVDAEDLIVSNDVTDLTNAARVTHRIKMEPSILKRMQNLGVYRDVSLTITMPSDANPVDQAKSEVTGINYQSNIDEEDRDREIFEVYCKYDIPKFASKNKLLDGVPLPYIVTIDKDSREVLSVRRNWKEEDEQCLPKLGFVEFSYIRGFGFYGIGLLNIMGGLTNVSTAAIREMIDAGMFASFPGFLYADDGPTSRQKTNIFRVPPGGGKGIQTGGRPISDTVMPLPYKEPSQALGALIEALRQDAQRLGGTADVEVGEGRQDAPVGTTLALIEQATKPQDAVHKRLFQAQAQEFRMLVDLFREDPESLWRNRKKPEAPWTEEIILQALDDYDLVPVADPNTSSHMQRVMRTSSLIQIAQAAPQLFNQYEVAKKALTDLKLGNPAVLLNPPGSPSTPDPKTIEAQAKNTLAEAKLKDVQDDASNRQSEANEAKMKQESDEKIAMIKQRTELLKNHQNVMSKNASDIQNARNNIVENDRKRKHDLNMKFLDILHQKSNEPIQQPGIPTGLPQ